MISFEPITEETLYIADEIVRSNHVYNALENGRQTRTAKELKTAYLPSSTKSLFVKADDTYVGILDYMEKNPNDGQFWIGALLIHEAYHGYSFGTQAYLAFEAELPDTLPAIRLGVLKSNPRAKVFWERLGFHTYAESNVNGALVDCMEKVLRNEE
ncbi:GNAT family N-acetyltransferase [Priestia koreensis]|uniref:GNAT family N-acetyltransferase n=1 Tax=Priestia koreensis TaxID=284581 RepID=UPI0028F6E4BC|nr:GNAT family N-acetyltransferase [Priestia koreensis]